MITKRADLGAELLRRLVESGLELRGDDVNPLKTEPVAPDIPEDLLPDAEIGRALQLIRVGGKHCCEMEDEVVLPLALIWDVRVPQRMRGDLSDRALVSTVDSVKPYYLGDLTLIHRERETYPRGSSWLSPVEAACLQAQFPRYGAWTSIHGGTSWQAYHCLRQGKIVIDANGPHPHHHAGLCMRRTGGLLTAPPIRFTRVQALQAAAA